MQHLRLWNKHSSENVLATLRFAARRPAAARKKRDAALIRRGWNPCPDWSWPILCRVPTLRRMEQRRGDKDGAQRAFTIHSAKSVELNGGASVDKGKDGLPPCGFIWASEINGPTRASS